MQATVPTTESVPATLPASPETLPAMVSAAPPVQDALPGLQEMLHQCALGALVMACFVIGLFFFRFYHKTRDRLFAIFATAFWLLGLNWLTLVFIQQDEARTWLYLIRLLAFVLILYGIIDKNRAPARSA